MSKYKHYIVFYDDGHDSGELTFTSVHRARSKGNLEDAKRALKCAYGYLRANELRINWVERDLNYLD